MASTLFPVILAGGSGTRLWPLSRKNFPKQFLCLQGERSLLQQTLARVELLGTEQAIIVSNDAHYFLCQEQLQFAQLNLTYILEPCARNTAPAIAATAHFLNERVGPEALMLILPSDHWFADEKQWQEAMLQGATLAADSDHIITFGITPDGPKTGYGYIEADTPITPFAHRIARFQEKPDIATAQIMVQQKNYFWNSGMFICKAGLYLEELRCFAPDIARDTQIAFQKAHYQHDFIRLEQQAFAKCQSESIDYAVMEKTTKAAIIPLQIEWSDLGCWNAVAEANANRVDEQGNAVSGNVIAQKSHDCLIRSEHMLVTTMGINDLIIVATADAVLVADKRYSQEVKTLVNTIGERHGSQIDDHLRVARPWGYFEVLAEGPSFKVKRLMVKAGAKLSLQMHQHRAEHWVVVGGEADVINGNESITLKVNQSTYIPQKTRHRLANLGDDPLYVIEVQSGSYLGEDDIQRFEDMYQRDTACTID